MFRVLQFRGGTFQPADLAIVREQPIAIAVNGTELATLLCTPVRIEALVLGFLTFEGVIAGLHQVEDLRIYEEDGLVEVTITGEFVPPKRRIITSGCTGGITFSLDPLVLPPDLADVSLDAERIFPLIRELYVRAQMYRESRGIHAAALSDGEKILLVAEDVGRHNCLDKILGEALLQDIPTAGRILLSTGRISTEMLRKGTKMQTPFLLSRTSPTSLAVQAAKRLGITLIGYVRGESFTVYSHPERLTASGSHPADLPLDPPSE